MPNDPIIIEVRDGGLGTSRPRKTVNCIERVPQDRAGYQVVTYKGKQYILRGGIRTDHFISLDLPLNPIHLGTVVAGDDENPLDLPL